LAKLHSENKKLTAVFKAKMGEQTPIIDDVGLYLREQVSRLRGLLSFHLNPEGISTEKEISQKLKEHVANIDMIMRPSLSSRLQGKDSFDSYKALKECAQQVEYSIDGCLENFLGLKNDIQELTKEPQFITRIFSGEKEVYEKIIRLTSDGRMFACKLQFD
jgi:hypothetical protein